MRIVCLSDTHGLTDKLEIPDGDVLIHAGDICGIGRNYELDQFNHFLAGLPHRHKIYIAGNHDSPLERGGRVLAEKLVTKAIYLQDNGIEIEGVKFWGSPWQPEFFNWSYNLPRGPQLAAKWAMIPGDTDVLVTHGPPLGILDRVNRRDNAVGCEDLLKRVEDIKPKLHVFGHIHESYGVLEKNGTIYANASICNGHYWPGNPAIVVDL